MGCKSSVLPLSGEFTDWFDRGDLPADNAVGGVVTGGGVWEELQVPLEVGVMGCEKEEVSSLDRATPTSNVLSMSISCPSGRSQNILTTTRGVSFWTSCNQRNHK